MEKKKFLASLWSSLQSVIIDVLKEQTVKLSIKAFLNSGAGVGLKAWLITLIAKEFYDEIGEPVIKAAFVEIGYQYDRVEGKVFLRRLETAKEGNDVEVYNDIVDDINSELQYQDKSEDSLCADRGPSNTPGSEV